MSLPEDSLHDQILTLAGELAHDQHIAWHIANVFGTVTGQETDQSPEIRDILTLSVDLHWQTYSQDARQEKWAQLIELLILLKKHKVL